MASGMYTHLLPVLTIYALNEAGGEMAKEIERKYLVQSDAWRHQSHSEEQIRQGYLCTDKARNVRIRLQGEHAFLTIKGEQKGQTRDEFEYPIPLEDAHQIIDHLCIKPLIMKTRHKLQDGDLIWEIDEFAGANSPLVLAEVETPSQDPPATKPAWVGEEVSNDPRYLNINLVDHPYSAWADDIEQRKITFHFKRSESVAHGLKRLVTEGLEAASVQLSQYEMSLEEAVHEGRKSLKKVRALLRLMRPVLGADFAKENAALRDIGRQLSAIRDAHALIETLDYLQAKYRHELDDGGLTNLRQTLLDRKQAQEEHFDSAQQIPLLVENLQQTCSRAQTWPYKQTDILLVAKGVATSLQRGREQFHKAYQKPRPETFHDWRKRAKDLRYQLTLLQKLWPAVFQGYLESAKTLEELLGMEHNLTVLRHTLVKDGKTLGSAQEHQWLLPIIDLDHKAIRREAETLGARLYSDKPKQWIRRISRSWDAWKQEKRHL